MLLPIDSRFVLRRANAGGPTGLARRHLVAAGQRSLLWHRPVRRRRTPCRPLRPGWYAHRALQAFTQCADAAIILRGTCCCQLRQFSSSSSMVVYDAAQVQKTRSRTCQPSKSSGCGRRSRTAAAAAPKPAPHMMQQRHLNYTLWTARSQLRMPLSHQSARGRQPGCASGPRQASWSPPRVLRLQAGICDLVIPQRRDSSGIINRLRNGRCGSFVIQCF